MFELITLETIEEYRKRHQDIATRERFLNQVRPERRHRRLLTISFTFVAIAITMIWLLPAI